MQPSSSRTLERTCSAMNAVHHRESCAPGDPAGPSAQDRDAMLEVRELDVRHHPPLEAGDETGFEAGDLAGRPIAGEDDLAAAFVERVEGVKKLLLRRFLSLEEVDVVDEQEIGLTETPAKIMRGPLLNRHHVFICELLGAKVGVRALTACASGSHGPWPASGASCRCRSLHR